MKMTKMIRKILRVCTRSFPAMENTCSDTILTWEMMMTKKNEGKPKIIPFEVKSVVASAASLFNILNKSGVVQKYTKIFAQRVINMLVKGDEK